MGDINFFDIVTTIVALWAIVAGWRRGVILQLCSLVGIVLSIYLSSRYATAAGEFLGMNDDWKSPGGFIVVAILTLIAVALVGYMLRKIVQVAGLGVLDILLGIAISLLKWLLLLSAVYSVFATLNRSTNMIKEESLQKSKSFYPICKVADYVMPFVGKAFDDKSWEEWLPEDSVEEPQELIIDDEREEQAEDVQESQKKSNLEVWKAHFLES